MLQRAMRVSSEAEASQVQSGEKATLCTPALWHLSTPKARGLLTPYTRTKPSQQATATILPSFRPAIAFTPYIPKTQTPPTRRVREVRMGEKGEGGRGRKEMMGECAEWIGEEEQGTREEKGEEGERRREQQRMERQPLFLAPRA
eukprot:Tamp_06428.p3 GENE.Tamp_06428~~Tamp_06428.p3  ORF type:complete len:145 (-),score=24.23 Tamp_06428:667-1101(-)